MKVSNISERKNIKVTVEGGLTEDSSLQITMSSYATIDEWIETFRTILVHQGFTFSTVSDIFDRDEADVDQAQETEDEAYI